MFFSREKEPVKDEDTKKASDPFDKMVKCQDCLCLLLKVDAQLVEVECGFGHSSIWAYCAIHRKPYSRVEIWSGNAKYFGRVEMDEKGNQIKGHAKPR